MSDRMPELAGETLLRVRCNRPLPNGSVCPGRIRHTGFVARYTVVITRCDVCDRYRPGDDR